MAHRKLERFAELETFPNAVFMPYAQAAANKFPLKGNWSDGFFKNDNPLVLELGCGKGEYTLDLAARYPSRNFIGVDIKGNRIWKGAKTAFVNGISNAGFLRTRIDFIEKAFAPSEVSEIWITFPDPQKEKERKRLTHPMFLERYRKILRPEGLLHLKTDSRPLYDYTRSVLEKVNGNILDATSDLYAGNTVREDVCGTQTFYEKIYLSKGSPIHYLKFTL